MDPKSIIASRWNRASAAIAIVLLVCLIALLSLFVHDFIDGPNLNRGNAQFSIEVEPVSHNGIYPMDGDDGATSSPAFNVTLHAKSTYKHKFCSNGAGTVQALYSGITIAMGQVAGFCMKPKGSSVMTATALSGWPALPASLQHRIDNDRRNGGVELEVDLTFVNEIMGLIWVRCRTMLDAMDTSPCKAFALRHIAT